MGTFIKVLKFIKELTKDKVKYDQAEAAIDLLGKIIKNKIKDDGMFPSTIADLRNTKDFDEKKLIDPFSSNGQFVKYQIVPAGRGMVLISSFYLQRVGK
ncbi:MAG: hypothetical protein HY920_03815 [Elusimicrobia bacterium]|nr:hypothetical protein [Elusimicrobiota bacterium]